MNKKRKTGISDQQILDHLRAGEEEGACRKLYVKLIPMANRFISSSGGNDDEALELVNKALIILITKVRQGKFRYDAALTTYLMAVIKNLWFKKVGKSSVRMVELKEDITDNLEEEDFDIIEEMEDDEDYFEKNRMVQECLDEMQEKGRGVLQAFYFERKKDKETAEELGFKSSNVVKSARGKYLKKLRDCVRDKLKMNNDGK